MDENQIKSILKAHPWAERIRCVQEVSSTNTVVKKLAEQAAPEGTTLIADRQTAGRGRLGRSFYSPPNSGIYLSVLLRPQKPAAELMDLTARAAVCVYRALEETCGIQVQIKWVNDLCLHGKKLGGILTELIGGAKPAVIIGVGINCTQTEFPPELSEIAGSVFSETGIRVDRQVLAAAIIRQFSTLFEIDWLSVYRANCVTIGKPVKLCTSQKEREAFALDVTQTAALLVRYPNGEIEQITDGEASVRGLGGEFAQPR